MKPGDYLLCYLTRVSRWVGVLEVTGEPLFDGAPIWSSRVSPAGFASGSSSRCAPSMGVPVLDMRGELTVFQDLDNPNRWQGPLRGSPARGKAADGEAVVRRCTRRRPPRWRGRWAGWRGSAASPLSCRGLPTAGCRCRRMTSPQAARNPEAAVSGHAEIQYLPVRLGAEMGF